MNESTRRGHGAAAWVSVALAGLTLYVLSAGPAQYLSTHWTLSKPVEATLEVIYKPLIWLYDRSDTAHTVFDWYFGLWEP